MPLVGFDDEPERAGERDGPRVRVGVDLRTATVGTVVLLALSAVVVWLALTRAGGPVVPLDDVRPAVAASDAPVADASGDSDGSPAPAGTAGGVADGGTGSGSGGSAATAGTAGPDAGSVVVHVAGHVRTPGLVTLAAGSRVADAITAAGGADGEADLGALNLARLVVDGEQIRVPAPGDPPVDTGGSGGGTSTGGGSEGGAEAGGAGATGVGAVVDVNTADVAALDTLPGVGPVLAQRIVDHRAQNGPFATVDELADVSGIGPAVLAKIRDLVRT
ncbi:competence protein ComEA [Sediminihabitans luteus]|uniref:Competence protein ComEA n=1 Tax=Sediminihabitans luteus TaxID=1138585 RepID=A0A2M9CPU2_9CELL|nr:competence protein ComEA [Sediminihabitans luteus]